MDQETNKDNLNNAIDKIYLTELYKMSYIIENICYLYIMFHKLFAEVCHHILGLKKKPLKF